MPIDRGPRLDGSDSSAALLREGYTFGAHRFLRSGSDAFATRLVLRKAVVAHGEESARLLYERDRMTRRRARPVTRLTLLEDFGSVELLDERPHRHRKAMFMSLMTPAALTELGDLVESEWRGRIPGWQEAGDVVLFDAVRDVLYRAVCAWSGIPLADDEVAVRTRQFAAMVEGAGSVGPRNLRGQLLRHRAESWAGQIIERIRSWALPVEEGRPARGVAEHRDEHGRLLDVDVARVELINVLAGSCRRCVATSRSSPWPGAGHGRSSSGAATGSTAVRGSSSTTTGPVTTPGSGTSSPPSAPSASRAGTVGPTPFVPQGGGDLDVAHRCAGKWLTISVVKRSVRMLTTAMSYEVPLQDPNIDLSRRPAAPASGVRIFRVQPA